MYELNVLLNGKRVDVYHQDNDYFIEGREGSEYELELVNNSNTRAEFVVSVDGLSIIDGQEASSGSIGYILNAYQTIRIPGWLLDSDAAAKFKFGKIGNSYSAASGKGTTNVGVIGLQVFREKQQVAVFNNYEWWNRDPWNLPYKERPKYWLTGGCFGGSAADYTLNNSGIATCSGSALRSLNSQSLSQTQTISEPATRNLGTEFGAATEFKTTNVAFNRDSNIPGLTSVIYYDDSKGLNKRGIVLNWQKKTVPSKPNPFPGNFCEPPKNWKRA